MDQRSSGLLSLDLTDAGAEPLSSQVSYPALPRHLAVSPDGTRVAALLNGRLTVDDLVAGRLLASLPISFDYGSRSVLVDNRRVRIFQNSRELARSADRGLAARGPGFRPRHAPSSPSSSAELRGTALEHEKRRPRLPAALRFGGRDPGPGYGQGPRHRTGEAAGLGGDPRRRQDRPGCAGLVPAACGPAGAGSGRSGAQPCHLRGGASDRWRAAPAGLPGGGDDSRTNELDAPSSGPPGWSSLRQDGYGRSARPDAGYTAGRRPAEHRLAAFRYGGRRPRPRRSGHRPSPDRASRAPDLPTDPYPVLFLCSELSEKEER